ncbi:acyl-CoA dehydrogenase family protein [Zhongshania aliphaticivorans]|uniref:acyl-CoA dehydrogenase family protein n=1 Tax=Zhongshania aliphaticivorans TaxID=1470434 RepID=UPI0012E64BB1|nr:acyl-CoA dehydrogenase family protein [Zhongshania aliphaticivorans]CAA0101424.1 Acyl-CoA dehydrogenase, short-chain specific [Zhongshania aliphaticivorans]
MFVDLDELYLSEELQQMRWVIRRFVEAEIVPNGEAWEELGTMPREVWRKMGELGILGMSFPEEFGGTNMGPLASLILSEELARSTFGGVMAGITVHTDMSASHIVRHGSDAMKAKYLPEIVAGEKVCAVAVTEPDAGSDVAGMKTTARREGDHYVLNGSKMFITNGVYGDLYMLAARTDSSAKGSRGISLFVLEKGMPGFTVGKTLKKTGWLSSDTALLYLDDVKVPVENLIGEENKGFYYIMEGFELERICIGGQCVGQSEKAIELTMEWLKSRKAFGKTLWDMQNIKLDMAALVAELAAAKQLAYHTAHLDAQGKDASMSACMVKSHLPELMNRILYKCVQFHGGMGYMRETAVERISRDARLLPIGGGATEVMLLELAKKM